MSRAVFRAAHGGGDKQEGEDGAGDFKYQHGNDPQKTGWLKKTPDIRGLPDLSPPGSDRSMARAARPAGSRVSAIILGFPVERTGATQVGFMASPSGWVPNPIGVTMKTKLLVPTVLLAMLALPMAAQNQAQAQGTVQGAQRGARDGTIQVRRA